MKVVDIPNVNEMTRQDAALRYADHGVAVFPVVPNAKNPLTTNGFYDATTDTNVINDWFRRSPDANVGMATGTVNGIMVVDVDCKSGKNGEVALNGLEKIYGELPETRRHRTPSGGYHLLFSIGSQVVPDSQGKIGEGIDIKAEGGYVVAPPSVIGDGRYEVVNPDVSVVDAPEWLVKLACEKKADDKKPSQGIAIPEGERNDHIFKYALDCKRRGISKDDAIAKTLVENERCDPPLSGDEIVRTVASAYRYETSNVPVAIEEMNRTHAAIKMGGNCYVLEEIICPTFNRPDFELLSTKGFKDFYCNQYVEIDGKKQRLGEAWLGHTARKSYQGLTFNPKYTPEGYYNIWRGFAVEPKQGDCSLYLKHIEENIADGNKAVYDYIIAWMAHTVQHPDNLVGVAIVMKGSMGVGKGVYADEFGKLFGRHYMLLNDSGQLVGKFNGHMKDKCLLFADEAFWAGDKAAEGKLKSMITEPTITIEMKGKDAYSVKNNLHMIFATNNEWSAPAGPRERRFFVIEVGSKHEQDHPYFKAICDQMDNGGREALLHYLKNYDVSDINLRQFPQTTALRDAKLLTFSPAQKFWHHVLETGYLHPSKADGWGDGIIQTEHLHESYQKFVQDMGIKHKATDTELGMQLKNMLPKDGFKKDRLTIPVYNGTARKNCYVLPSLAECRLAFNIFVNTDMDWPAE